MFRAMAMNKIGDQISSSIRDIFAPDVAAPPCKKERKHAGRADTSMADTCKTEEDSASSAGQTRAASPSAQPPFNKQQCEWMGHAVALSNEAVIRIFGEHVEERFKDVEAEIITQGEKIRALEREMQELKNTREAALDGGALVKRVEALENAQKSTSSAASDGGGSNSTTSQRSSDPLRTIAIMGGLGTRVGEQDLKDRARKAMVDAGRLADELRAEQDHVSRVKTQE